MKVGIERLCHFRQLAGYSQKELATFLGVTKNTIVNYETGRTSPPMPTVVALAHILSTTTDQLLSYSPQYNDIFKDEVCQANFSVENTTKR